MKTLKALLIVLILIVDVNSTVAKEEIPTDKTKAETVKYEETLDLDSAELLDLEEPTLIVGVEKNKSLLSKIWKGIKGKRAPNSILVGMFSHHTSSKDYREVHHLYGVEFKGVSLSTFINSHDNRTYFAALARDVYTKQFKKVPVKLSLGYRAGLLHGYQEQYPDLLGFTPLIVPTIWLDYKRLGMNFIIIPDDKPIFTVGFRVNIGKKNRPKV